MHAAKANLTDAIPAPVNISAVAPLPKATPKTETYSVVVNNIKASELLFALARDAKLNVDIHPGIQGSVTLNAVDQTLKQLLQRIAKQIDIRWELDGNILAVMPDTPFLRIYKVDYVNLSREAAGTISANSQINTGVNGGTGMAVNPSSTTAAGNVSIARVENRAGNHFWESLEKNIKDLLRETDKLLPEGSSETVVEHIDQQSTTGTGATTAATRNSRVNVQTQPQGIAGSPNPVLLQQEGTTLTRKSTFREAASVIVHAETGVVTVRATGRQHEKVQEFLDHVTHSARRQVMIEATIVEVELGDAWQQGIDWSRLRADGSGFSIRAPITANATHTQNPFVIGYSDKSNPLDVTLTLNLLEQFGSVKVLSSPRLSVLNNQAALLKVVENKVYFTVKADLAAATVTGGQATKAITTTPQSVSVGLVMMVMPQISESDVVTLNVRPSITSIASYVPDPNPEIATIGNHIPEIRTREIESTLRVGDGQVAVLGGLMQEHANRNTSRIPGLGMVPLLGELFTRRDNAMYKSELVVFLRPVVIRNGDEYGSMQNALPDDTFFAPSQGKQPFTLGQVSS
ncbi:MAG TPA: type II and III secretion system protein [Rhodocyclaceae bacterium]|nr:type II and III secretion system protein [Rhodocyclaceae bacterium]